MHLDEGTIHAWLDGALPPDESARIEAHAKECAECSALVAEARGFIAGSSRIVSSLDIVRGNVIPAASPAAASKKSVWKKLKLTPARAAIAATLLVGVASMFSVRERRLDNVTTKADTAVAVVAPASAQPAAAPAVVAQQPAVIAGPRPVQPKPAAPEPALDAAKTSARMDRMEVATAPASAPASAPATPGADSLAEARRRSLAEPATPTSVAAMAAAAPRQMSAAKNDAKTAANVAGAAAPSAAPSAAPAAIADAAPRRAFSTTSAVALPSQVEGCYQLTIDSASAPSTAPDRFRLQHDSSTGRNVVRIPTLRGDSLLPAATWTSPATPASLPGAGRALSLRSASGSVLVSLMDATAGRVELAFSTNRPTAALTFSGRTLDATVQRNSCDR